MDAYLSIAEHVLRMSRKPLGPRTILKAAYANNLVPPHLHGKTQHKTLQARLSEDILVRRERSAFFRTRPGQFFLREFISDESIPAQFRVPIVARRRSRQLPHDRALALNKIVLGELLDQTTNCIKENALRALIKTHSYHYAKSTSERRTTDALVWSFVLVLKGSKVLTYRHGNYREGREHFISRRSLGFFSPVVENDLTLFQREDHGIVEAGLRGMCVDLDLDGDTVWGDAQSTTSLRCIVCSTNDNEASDLLAVVNFQCPDWFEPHTRRLALNDLCWHDLTTNVNHLEDFDPWSQTVLKYVQQVELE